MGTQKTAEDIKKRIADLATVKAGWLDGCGEDASQVACQKAEAICLKLLETLPELVSRIYPMESGHILIEWDKLGNGSWAGDLEVRADGSMRASAGHTEREECLEEEWSAEEVTGENIDKLVSWMEEMK